MVVLSSVVEVADWKSVGRKTLRVRIPSLPFIERLELPNGSGRGLKSSGVLKQGRFDSGSRHQGLCRFRPTPSLAREKVHVNRHPSPV